MSRTFFCVVAITAIVVGGLRAQQPTTSGASELQAESSAWGRRSLGVNSDLRQFLPSEVLRQIPEEHRIATESVLAQASALFTSPRAGVSGDGLPLAEFSWGLLTMPLPEYLRHQGLGVPAEQGRLVIHIFPASPAAVAGLVPGDLILEVNDRPLNTLAGLPSLGENFKVLVMGESGLREVEVGLGAKGFAHATSSARAFAGIDGGIALPEEMEAHALAQSMFMPRVPRANALVTVRSLAVSEVNGQMSVSAVVDGSAGSQRIELRGSRDEIHRQLQGVAPEIRDALGIAIGL